MPHQRQEHFAEKRTVAFATTAASTRPGKEKVSAKRIPRAGEEIILSTTPRVFFEHSIALEIDRYHPYEANYEKEQRTLHLPPAGIPGVVVRPNHRQTRGVCVACVWFLPFQDSSTFKTRP